MTLFLTANEAREITEVNLGDISTYILNSILKEVNDFAHKGLTKVVSCHTNIDIVDIRIIERRLKELGYKVNLEIKSYLNYGNDYIFTVSWDREEEKMKKDLKLLATERWCSVSNAIIKKYKFMVEDNKEDIVYNSMETLRSDLMKFYGFIKEDFENWE